MTSAKEELTPEKCFGAYKSAKQEEKLLQEKRKKEREEEIEQWTQELIQKIDPYLESGNLPQEFKSHEEVIKKAKSHYSRLGWFCFAIHNDYWSYLTVDFPGPFTKFWRMIKNFFLRLFKSEKALPPPRKTAYRD